MSVLLPKGGGLRLGVEFGQAVEEGGEAGVDDAVGVAVGAGGVVWVCGWEFDGVVFGGGDVDCACWGCGGLGLWLGVRCLGFWGR